MIVKSALLVEVGSTVWLMINGWLATLDDTIVNVRFSFASWSVPFIPKTKLELINVLSFSSTFRTVPLHVDTNTGVSSC